MFRRQIRRSYGEGLAGITGRGYGAAKKGEKTVRYFACTKQDASSLLYHLELEAIRSEPLGVGWPRKTPPRERERRRVLPKNVTGGFLRLFSATCVHMMLLWLIMTCTRSY